MNNPTTQSPRHQCPWPGCPEKVDTELWGCATHWFRLPTDIRKRLWETHTGQVSDDDRLASIAECQQWMATQISSKEGP